MMSNKKIIRKGIQSAVKKLGAEEIKKESQRVANNVFGFDKVGRIGNSVSVFLPMKHEVDTYCILPWLFERKNSSTKQLRVYIPRVIGPGHADMKMPELASLEELNQLEKSKWDIPEFTLQDMEGREDGMDGSIESLVDTVLVPGVAFTCSGLRLGHGKGYYDSFINRLTSKRKDLGLPKPIAIGLAFDQQIVDSLPTGPFDATMDYVITPSKSYCINE